MALAVREQTRTMQEALRFLRYLQQRARRDGASYNSTTLREAWRQSDSRDQDRFRDVCESITGDSVFWCDDCGDPVWEQSWHGTTGDDTEVCDRCLGEYYYCSHCEQYYSESHQHEHGSFCSVPQPRFRFPLADGRSVGSDESIDVETPAGLISDAGMKEIAEYVYRQANSYGMYSQVLNNMDHEWTNKSGNFTKRIAKLALQQGHKIDPQILSEIGNLARANSSSGKTYRLTFSRDLNADASEWFHGGSCWWTDYAESRCALKQCGGLGVRTFDDWDTVTGRAWIVPLKEREDYYGQRGLALCDDPMDADAFVVFNAYGPDGYEFARLVAQLTGWSYRKLGFSCRPMYVNNNSGFLVAPQQVCERTEELSFHVNLNCGCEHD